MEKTASPAETTTGAGTGKSENKLWAQRQIKSFEAKDLLRRKVKSPPAMPVGIAVMDTGVDFSHPALSRTLWTARENFSVKVDGADLNFPKGSFGFDAFNVEDENKRGFPIDAHNHGTMIAGIIGADDSGVAAFDGDSLPAQMLTVKAFASKNSFETIDGDETKNIIGALNFILEVKETLKRLSNPIDLRIVNLSFGFYRRKNPRFADALAAKIRELSEEGLFIVASIGNSGRNLDAATPGKDFTYYPAGIDCDGLISVAATNRNGELWTNSNFGKRSVHIAAPGENIYTTKINARYSVFSGTSLAAPFVSAAAALLLAAKPEMKNTDIKNCLLENVNREPVLEVASGGKLDIHQSVLKVI